ncbi:SDR family oxidoreductase [Arthrobacter sp. Br18]|uniref:SDR family oxidoreductase n=1 Tax=Arthrobacter sp. Br18 TaxID=1312954 RepID=UPI0004AEFBA8|nr:SDR family oxidoreductase [Arthrobacter sp. Br18]
MILLVGATGQLGRRITEKLLQHREPIRALTRPGSDTGWLRAAGVELVVGDLKDPASLDRACTGVDTVITTATSMARGEPDTLDTVDRSGNRNLVDAATKQGVRRFVFISALGASPDSPLPLLRAKAEAENGLRRHSLIAIEDVAAYTLAALRHREADNRMLQLGGPEAVSWRAAVTCFEEHLGRPIEVHTASPGDPIPAMPGFLVELLTALDGYDSPVPMADLARTYGITPTTLADFVARHGSSSVVA